ncbi:MAG: glycosyltransferase [Thermodesulfobacteriota bacterium]
MTDNKRPAPEPAAPASQAAVEKARDLLGQGQIEPALALLRPLADRPDAPNATLRLLARALMGGRFFDEAVQVFRRLLEAGPEQAGLRNSLAMALVMAGRRDEAAEHLRRAVDLEPDNHVFAANLGKYFLLGGDHDQAAQAFERALTLAPEAARADLLGHLNQSLAQLGRPLRTFDAPAPAPAPSPIRPERAPQPAAPAGPARPLLLCCAPGTDAFVDGIVSGLAPEHQVEKLVSEQRQDFVDAIRRHDTVWIEWGNELAEFLTKQAGAELMGKRVILRIHAYEVMSGLAQRVDFTRVTDLVFVCAGMRDLLLAARPEVRRQVRRIHVIPNGIDTDRIQLTARRPGFELAYVGYINFKKGPQLLWHALRALHAHEPRCRLHVAGVFQDGYHEIAFRHFLSRNGLEGAVRFHGWVKDIDRWLADKNAILCTSLSESQGLGLMEAMASGVRPLIHNFHTAEGIYPRQFLWNNLDELVELFRQPYDPALGRRFVADNYSLALALARLRRMLAGEDEVVFEGFTFDPPALPDPPPACFSPDRAARAAANKSFGLGLKGAGQLKPATVHLERAWAQSQYTDGETLAALVDCHQGLGDFAAIAGPYREAGLAAAVRGDYETMLAAFYEVYYAAYVRSMSYRWQHFDPAIDAVLRLVAPRVQPLPGHEEVSAALDPAKIKLVMGLDSFQTTWATVKRFADIGFRLDKRRFEVIYISRMPPDPAWQPLIERLTQAGCHVLAEPGQAQYPKLQRFLYLLKKMPCDLLMLNTQFLTPFYDLLAHCGAAGKVVKFVSQGGGRESSSDLAVTSVKGLIIDEVADCAYIGPAYVTEAPDRGRQRRREPGRLRAVCVGRPVKFFNNPGFWNPVLAALRRVPGLSLDVIGAKAEEVFGGPSPLANLKFRGFRPDAPELVAGYDLMLDTWPSGGGCTVREAHAAGVPVISCRTPWREHYREGASFYGGLDDFIHPELLLPDFDPQRLLDLLARLAGDLDFYERIAHECRTIPVLGPEQFADRLAETLEALARGAGQGA